MENKPRIALSSMLYRPEIDFGSTPAMVAVGRARSSIGGTTAIEVDFASLELNGRVLEGGRTVRFLYARDMDSANRLGHGHRRLRRRWDDAIQMMVSMVTDESWQSVAQNREMWQSLEAAFIA